MLKRLFTTLLAFGIFAMPALAEADNPALYFVQTGSTAPLQELVVAAGDEVKLSVFVDDFSKVGAISGKLILPLEDLSLAGVDQSFSLCTAWDEVPKFTGGEIRFACGQGDAAKTAGPLFTITLVANKQFTTAELSLVEIIGINETGDYWRPATVKLDISALNYTPTSGSVSEQLGSPTAVVLVNLILVVAIIISLVLAYRYLRLAKKSKFKD
jgi:hypothetical protein